MKSLHQPLAYTVADELLHLYPQRALFWPAKEILLMADLHLGKINHFRKSGVPVPAKADAKNLEQLLELIQLTRARRIIFLGDLFHSHYNDAWEEFGQLIKHFSDRSFELVLGNHDILSQHQYEKHGIVLHEELILEPFLFTHHPIENYEGDLYNMAGHIHPGAHMVGKGKQSLTLPCFYFGSKQSLLPAFGAFTGLARIAPKENDQVFVIVENKILKV